MVDRERGKDKEREREKERESRRERECVIATTGLSRVRKMIGETPTNL